MLLLEENAPLAAKWKKSAIAEVMLQVQRTAGFLELYQKLQKEGVHPLVVKGLICRSFYKSRTFGYQRMKICCLERKSLRHLTAFVRGRI